MIPNAIPAGARPKIAPRARLHTDRISGKRVLLYPEGVLMLNPTGEAIVALCTGSATLQDIVNALAARYNTSPETIAPDVADYLNRMRARNLLEFVDAAPRTA